MKNRLIKKSDIILIALALLLAGLMLICINLFSKTGNYVTVKVDGFTTKTLSLDEDIVYEIKVENKVTNILEISDGKASMIYADCPDKICVNHRSISKNNETIVCLPNKVVVTVVADVENDLDGVVG